MLHPSNLYAPLRLLLALLSGCVAIITRRLYFAVTCFALIIPSPATPAHWRTIWLPVETLRLALAIGLSASLIIKQHRILIAERRLIVGFGFSAGLALCLCGWLWIPQDWFEVAVTVRQYLYLMLATVTIGWWVRLWVRPVLSPVLLPCWCWWLFFGMLMASGGKGGLLWTVFKWKGGAETWALVGDIGYVGQILVACWLLMSLYAGEPTT